MSSFSTSSYSEAVLEGSAPFPGPCASQHTTATRDITTNPTSTGQRDLMRALPCQYGRLRRRHARGHLPPVELAEDHAARRRLQDAGHGDRHLLTNRLPALLYHDHRAVVKVAHALPE